MKTPIYLAKHAVTESGVKDIEAKTGRPVVLLHGNPKDVVLDVQEDPRERLATAAMAGLLASGIEYDREWLADQSYKMADSMLRRKAGQ